MTVLTSVLRLVLSNMSFRAILLSYLKTMPARVASALASDLAYVVILKVTRVLSTLLLTVLSSLGACVDVCSGVARLVKLCYRSEVRCVERFPLRIRPRT